MFKFLTGDKLFGEVTSVGPSEPMEGDYGTFQRLVIEVQPVDGSAPRQVWLPLPTGWPHTADYRSVLGEWMKRAAAVPEIHSAWDTAMSVQEALNFLKGKFVRFEEQTFEIGFGDRARTKSYLVPTKVYPNRAACAKEADEASTSSSGPSSAVGRGETSSLQSIADTDPSLLAEARAVWAGLSAVADQAQKESFFKQLMGARYRPELLQLVRS